MSICHCWGSNIDVNILSSETGAKTHNVLSLYWSCIISHTSQSITQEIIGRYFWSDFFISKESFSFERASIFFFIRYQVWLFSLQSTSYKEYGILWFVFFFLFSLQFLHNLHMNIYINLSSSEPSALPTSKPGQFTGLQLHYTELPPAPNKVTFAWIDNAIEY